MLLLTGHQVIAHPALPDTPRRPDFRAVDGDSLSTIFECVVATEMPVPARAQEARLNALLESLNKVETSDYFLTIDTQGAPDTPVPGGRWRTQVQIWIDSLIYADVLAIAVEGKTAQLPTISFEHDGLKLTVQALPKKPSARGKAGARPIGLQSGEACWVTSRLNIRDAIKGKASRYGELSCPYIVVINCIGAFADRDEIKLSCFGSDGLWPSSSNAAHTRVSAVLAFEQLLPWSVPRADAWLMHNPNATHPYTGPLTALPQTTIKGSDTRFVDGLHPRAIFGLSESWPQAQ
jgi:hypothetical protein